MIFATLSGSSSLREVSSIMLVCEGKVNHLGFSNYPKRSTLSDANKKRSSSVFAAIYQSIYNQYKHFLSDSNPIVYSGETGSSSLLVNYAEFANTIFRNSWKLSRPYLKEDTELIYLSEEEVMTLYNLPLISDKLNVVRENFCFACFTGLRYSDIQKLQPENIKSHYIEIRSEKTRDFLKIPLNHYAKAILERNEGNLPKLYSNQKTNNYLKELGEQAGLFESIHIVKYRGVEKVEFTEPKYKFLCTHTARRTFVTLCLEKGMRAETVRSITGHKDYKTFKKYIKLTDKIKLIEMNEVWSKKLYIA